MTVSKLDVGVWSGKLNEPPKSCIPNKAKMKMKRKRRKSRDMMDDKAFMRAITRLRKGDQYLEAEIGQTDNQSDLACAYTCTYNEHISILLHIQLFAKVYTRPVFSFQTSNCGFYIC